LALNVATTRMILTEGHNGPEAVSHIVAAFGQFVVGGNFVIGIIIFTILVLINFMVITKGSGRVAEVAARFTLDAMPGKQMAIDADLNAGMIDEPEARKRRQEIVGEANFYGAMDGASKFISGDAVAGIIITIVNIIGGFLIGVFQHDLSVADSASTYTILTIGDGLIAQLPALIISTSVGVIITRATKSDTVGSTFTENIIDQLAQDYKVLVIVGAILIMFALVPGLPTFSLGFVGLCFVGLGYMVLREKHPEVLDQIMKSAKKPKPKTDEEKELDLVAAGAFVFQSVRVDKADALTAIRLQAPEDEVWIEIAGLKETDALLGQVAQQEDALSTFSKIRFVGHQPEAQVFDELKLGLVETDGLDLHLLAGKQRLIEVSV